jgi:hypothetical protein
MTAQQPEEPEYRITESELNEIGRFGGTSEKCIDHQRQMIVQEIHSRGPIQQPVLPNCKTLTKNVHEDCGFWKMRACRCMTTNNCWNTSCPDHDDYDNKRVHDAATAAKAREEVLKSIEDWVGDASQELDYGYYDPTVYVFELEAKIKYLRQSQSTGGEQG